jgi:hypothetical protein
LLLQSIMPVENDLGAVRMRIAGATLSATASVGAALRPAFYGQVFAGPGLHLIGYRPMQSAGLPTLQPGPGQIEGRPVAVIGLGGVAGRRYPRLALVCELAIALTRTRYTITVGDDPVNVARGPDLMPTLGAEIWF